ncbi:hypothetical protein [Schumannella luteola]
MTAGSAPASPAEVLDFISSIVSSLAWPLVVLTLLLLFRPAIVSLLASLLARMDKLKRVKVPGGVEAEWFEDIVEDAEETAEDLPSRKTAAGTHVPDATSPDDIALELAKIDPASAVVTAFIGVERAAARALESLGEPIPRNPVMGVRKSSKIDPALKALIADLSHLRNAAAHYREIDISAETARRYIEAANRASRELELVALGAADDEL